jgi:hypothetical protein
VSRIYLCRAAPLARDWRAAIHANSKWLESFSEDAFLTTHVPVVRGHDGAHIGWVTSHATSDRWHVMALTLDEDDGSIGVGTGVSIQAKILRTDPLLEQNGVRHCTLAKLDHVALLVDGERPMYAGAGVTRILAPSTKPIVRPAAAKPAPSRRPVVDLTAFLTWQEREQVAALEREGFDRDALRDLIVQTCRPRAAAVFA